MKNSIYIATALFILLTIYSCKKNTVQTADKVNSTQINDTTQDQVFHLEEDDIIIDDAEFKKVVLNKVRKLISSDDYIRFEDLQQQKIDRIEENSNVVIGKPSKTPIKNGNTMYSHLKESTVGVGKTFLSGSSDIDFNFASGFIIHEDGVIVTNNHVVEGKEGTSFSGVFVVDSKGNAYSITEILATSQSNDLAIVKIDTKGEKLKALDVAENALLGENVYMMGHPFGYNFFMTKGIISKKYLSSRDSNLKIAITAEFGAGASGGPIVNDYGQVVGIVAATVMNRVGANANSKGEVQLIVKEVIPVNVLNNYLKRE